MLFEADGYVSEDILTFLEGICSSLFRQYKKDFYYNLNLLSFGNLA